MGTNAADFGDDVVLNEAESSFIDTHVHCHANKISKEEALICLTEDLFENHPKLHGEKSKNLCLRTWNFVYDSIARCITKRKSRMSADGRSLNDDQDGDFRGDADGQPDTESLSDDGSFTFEFRVDADGQPDTESLSDDGFFIFETSRTDPDGRLHHDVLDDGMLLGNRSKDISLVYQQVSDVHTSIKTLKEYDSLISNGTFGAFIPIRTQDGTLKTYLTTLDEDQRKKSIGIRLSLLSNRTSGAFFTQDYTLKIARTTLDEDQYKEIIGQHNKFIGNSLLSKSTFEAFLSVITQDDTLTIDLRTLDEDQRKKISDISLLSKSTFEAFLSVITQDDTLTIDLRTLDEDQRKKISDIRLSKKKEIRRLENDSLKYLTCASRHHKEDSYQQDVVKLENLSKKRHHKEDSYQQDVVKLENLSKKRHHKEDSYHQDVVKLENLSKKRHHKEDSYQQDVVKLENLSKKRHHKEDSYQQDVVKLENLSKKRHHKEDSYQQDVVKLENLSKKIRHKEDSYQQDVVKLENLSKKKIRTNDCFVSDNQTSVVECGTSTDSNMQAFKSDNSTPRVSIITEVSPDFDPEIRIYLEALNSTHGTTQQLMRIYCPKQTNYFLLSSKYHKTDTLDKVRELLQTSVTERLGQYFINMLLLSTSYLYVIHQTTVSLLWLDICIHTRTNDELSNSSLPIGSSCIYLLRGGNKTTLHSRFWLITADVFQDAIRATATIGDIYYTVILPRNSRTNVRLPILRRTYLDDKDMINSNDR